MVNPKYQSGYYFELRVKKHFEKLGYEVIRMGRSSFPDLTVHTVPDKKGKVYLFKVECKVNHSLKEKDITLERLLNPKEIEEMHKILDKGFDFKVAFKIKPKGKIRFLEVKP